MKKLKIGFVLDESLDPADGVQQYVVILGRWLSAQGHEVHYLVGQTVRTDLKHVHSLSKNFKVRFNGNRLSLPFPASRRKLRRLLRAEKFNVLYVQMPYSPMLGQRIISAAPAGTIITGMFHVLPYSRLAEVGSRVWARLLRRSLRRFGEVFANSAATQRFIKKFCRLNSSVLPLVIEVERFAAAKPWPQYTDQTPTIMFLGRLVPRKGARTLLEAVYILVGRGETHLRVLICGKGPLDAELKHYVADHGLNDIVAFTGFVSEADKPRYVASADIIVYPSVSGESFGVVLLEAMAGGALVLAGDNPGYRSVLAPRPELLFPADDAHELASKISTYLRDKPACQSATAWEKRYVRQFDVAVVGRKLLGVYAKLLREAE